MSLRAEVGLLAAILVLAGLLRFAWLDTIPAGWHHDEALMGVMASEVYRGVQRPIFFSAYLGQEPLYIYLSAGMMWLMGGNQDILPLRTTSALVGLATVGVTYLLGRELFGRRVGLISSALLASSFWQVMLSRGGCRVITQPLLEGLTVFLVWRAARRGSLWYFAAAGIAFGGTIYTYLGARLFPGVLAAFAVWWLIANGRPPATARPRLAVFLGVSALSAAPLLFYFATHPGTFLPRINQVFVFENSVTAQDPLGALGGNIVKLLSTFTIYGDTLWRYNVPGRPILVGLAGLLFYFGLLVTAARALRRQAASAMILAWFCVMLFPSFLTHDVGGYTFRSMGLVPMLYLLPAIGVVTLWDWTVPRVPLLWQRRTQYAFLTLVVIMLAADGAITYRDYFTVWAGSFGAAYENMEDVVAASRFLERAAKPGEEEIFVSSDYYPHPVVAHLAPQVYPSVRWFDGNTTLVLPSAGQRDSLYVFPYSAWPKDLDRYLPHEAVVEQSSFANGVPEFVAYRLSPGQIDQAIAKIQQDPTFTKVEKNLGDTLEILGYQIDHRVVQGDDLMVTAVWRVLRDAPNGEYAIFSHLLDQQGQMWAQDDTTAFPSREWRAGDIVVGQYPMHVGQQVAAGKYAIEIGALDKTTMTRLAVKDAPPAEDTLRLGDVKVAASAPNNAVATNPLIKRLGSSIQIEGFDLQRVAGTSPEIVRVDLHWRALATPDQDYTVFVQLLSPDGRLVTQADSQPDQGRFPTSYWEPGEQIVDRHELLLSQDLPAGRYQIVAGLYRLSTGQRLIAEDGQDYLLLTSLDVSR